MKARVTEVAHGGCSEYSMRYRPELDLVLKDISLTIVCTFSHGASKLGFDVVLNRIQKKKSGSLGGQALESRL